MPSDGLGKIETCLAYLAGFFDGEGSVTSRDDTQVNGKAWTVSVTNTQPEPIRLLRSMFGGRVGSFDHGGYKGKRAKLWNYKRLYRWSAHGANARRFVCAIFPYMRDGAKLKSAYEFLSVDEERDSLGKRRAIRAK